jgi:hypothetical protein
MSGFRVDDHAANLAAEDHEILFNRNGNPAKVANIEASYSHLSEEIYL